MDKYLTSYLDNQIIREYAEKEHDGYSLHVCDVDEHEQNNLIDLLFKLDPVTKDLLLDRAQELINERIGMVEAHDHYDEGLMPVHDNQTGEVNWIRR